MGEGGDKTPQQPELRRSGYGGTDAAAAKGHMKGHPGERDGNGPVPEENQPGHHPEVEQDQPQL
jgi:hypothetical protein